MIYCKKKQLVIYQVNNNNSNQQIEVHLENLNETIIKQVRYNKIAKTKEVFKGKKRYV